MPDSAARIMPSMPLLAGIIARQRWLEGSRLWGPTYFLDFSGSAKATFVDEKEMGRCDSCRMPPPSQGGGAANAAEGGTLPSGSVPTSPCCLRSAPGRPARSARCGAPGLPRRDRCFRPGRCLRRGAQPPAAAARQAHQHRLAALARVALTAGCSWKRTMKRRSATVTGRPSGPVKVSSPRRSPPSGDSHSLRRWMLP